MGNLYFGIIGIRRERTLYISIWYFIATFIAVAMLYLFNNMEVPTMLVSGYGSWIHSVSMYSGTNDALVQWWFGHNAVAFIYYTNYCNDLLFLTKRIRTKCLFL